MELAVNTFSKGLQSDTHPMVLSNDTLSGALNGTFVTMNGNEVILQNDMGNRRVDNAYLPSGYEPVGIKEYGGIIYVAAYNPITNKSQIGSFPSPERKISSEDGSELGGTLDLSQLLSDSNTYKDLNLNGLKCIVNDTILVPITKDTSLHAGDKFVVYADLNKYKNNITNYFNTKNKKIISPKNKKYTLALGVLNSQNEFVDITKTLVRWNDDKIINYTNKNYSDLYKFNDGYFIASKFTNPEFEETVNDAKLILERLVIPANTYAYKLVGPLYIKATLNHIKEFNYNIYGISTNDDKTEGTIWIEAFVTYNCPDGIISGGKGDDIYSTYAQGILNDFVVFDLKNIEGGECSNPEIISKEETKYDPNTELYTYKIVKKYDITSIPKTNIYKYVIGVRADNNDEIYLSGLSSIGEIDISLLGSGEVKLKGWRFINDYTNLSSTITYTFDAYPKYGESFLNFKFTITDIKNSENIIEIPSTLYNGRNTLNLDWKTYGLLPNKLYRVTWEYDIIGETSESKESTDDRWLLTTELFNDCYSPNSKNYILDYGNLSNEEESSIFKEKEIISYIINPNITNESKDPVITHEGEIISNKSDDIEIKYKTTLNILLLLNPNIEFNEKLYPDYIQINNNAVNNITISDINGKCDNELSYISLPNESSWTKPTNIEPSFEYNNNGGKNIYGSLVNYDYYKTKTDQEGDISNIFKGFYDYVKELHNFQKQEKRTYAMISLDFDERGGRDNHYMKGNAYQEERYPRVYSDGDCDLSDKGSQEHLASEHTDSKVIFEMKLYSPTVYEYFNNNLDDSIIFTWGYYKDGEGSARMNSNGKRKDGDYCNTNARVWWRTSYGDWALFPVAMNTKDINTSGDIVEFVKKYISDFHFAVYKNSTFQKAGLWKPTVNNYIRTNQYSFSYYITWKMESLENSAFDINNPSIEEFKCRYPKFEENNNLKPIECSEVFNISTAEEFLDVININFDSINGIDLSTYKFKDAKGNNLNPLNLYILDNNELILWNTSNIAIDSEFSDTNEMRRVLYNKQTLGKPNKPYDVIGNDDDSHTAIFYNNLNIVKGCKYE